MSSFSLPSAGGVVSLLNDNSGRPNLLERHSSGSSSIQSPVSTYGGNSSSDTGKESLASTFTSVTNSSTDSSSDGGRLGEIHALRKQLQGHSVDGKGGMSKKRDTNVAAPIQEVGSPSPKRQKSANTSASPQPQSDLYNDERRHSGASETGSILHQERLAASPRPINSSAKSPDESEGQVPTNMHKATSMSDADSSKVSTDVDNNRSQASTTTGKRRYPCSHPGCNKTFSTSGHAARHNRIHTGSKPYRCTFPGCNASFSRQDNSLQHYRTHVLHPKGRLNGSSLSGAANSSSSVDTTSPIDETDASVRMGRKALEDGTAIAVVREVVDGSGRRGEAVQRMVGQPKASRRESTSTSRSAYREPRDASHPLAEYKQGMDDGLGEDEAEDNPHSGSNWSNQSYGRSPSTHDSVLRGNPQPQSYPPSMYSDYAGPSSIPQPSILNAYRDSSGAWSQPSSMSYPPPVAVTSGRSSISGNGHPGSDYTYRPYMTGQGAPARYQPQSQEGTPLASAPASKYHRNSDALSPSSYAYEGSVSRNAPPVYPSGRPGTDSSFQLALPSSFDHRRSRSHGVAGHYPGMTSNASHGSLVYPSVKAEGPLNGSRSDTVSPPSTVTGRRDRSLSLLSSNHESEKGQSSLSGHNGAALHTTNSSKASPLSPRSSMRARPNAKELQLPLPPISKLPCSSDRSTSTLTPTTPLDEAVSLRPLGRFPSKSSHLPYQGTLEEERRVLPPLHSAVKGPSSSY